MEPRQYFIVEEQESAAISSIFYRLQHTETKSSDYIPIFVVSHLNGVNGYDVTLLGMAIYGEAVYSRL